MIEFSRQIAEKWSISQSLSDTICQAFEKGDSPFYLVDYVPVAAAETDISTVWEIYDFLSSMLELSTKKKRVIAAYKKAEKLAPMLEKRINISSDTYELDDLLIPLRPNPRSKGQLAAKKGLEPLADLIMKQDDETTPIEEIAQTYVGKDPSLKTADDVLQGLKDLLAERFAYDDTVRSMARDYAFEEGFFEVTPKNKKDPAFIQYVGKSIPAHELSKQEILTLIAAEENKTIRFKLGVQLFHIAELLRQHFITNPDATGFDLICSIIDDTWERLLQPIIERDVKERLRIEAEEWAIKQIAQDLSRKYNDQQKRGPTLFVDAVQKKTIILLAISGQGNLLGATSEKIPQDQKAGVSERLRQFLIRHRPSQLVLRDSELSGFEEAMVRENLSESEKNIESIKYQGDPAKKNAAQSEWMVKKFSSLLDESMLELYGLALMYLQPLALLPELGAEYFSAHPFQDLVSRDRLNSVINRIFTYDAVQKGVSIKEIIDSPLKNFASVTDSILQAIKVADSKEAFGAKNDILKVKGMTEVIFRNIAGYIIIPNANNLLDRSLVHPDFYPLVLQISDQLTASIDTMVSEPDIIRSYETDDFNQKLYIEKKLIGQMQVAQRYMTSAASKIKRKLKLNEVTEGTIVSGRVTNITQFGVFVNINAVCDGLIHISQLADEYVENPEQVVTVGDKVDVRILTVDVKKRRISLSMKNLGNKAPKVKPSKGQLDNLADHFKNR